MTKRKVLLLYSHTRGINSNNGTPLLRKIENIGVQERVRSIHEFTLRRLFDYSRLARMLENQTMNGKTA